MSRFTDLYDVGLASIKAVNIFVNYSDSKVYVLVYFLKK